MINKINFDIFNNDTKYFKKKFKVYEYPWSMMTYERDIILRTDNIPCISVLIMSIILKILE
jgi:hypothetical protein